MFCPPFQYDCATVKYISGNQNFVTCEIKMHSAPPGEGNCS